jgi:hypothetical protein
MNFDLEKYLKDNGLSYREVGDQFQLEHCPFCKSLNYKGNLHPYRFYINKETHLYNCFNCSCRGNAFQFIRQVSGSVEQYLKKEDYNFESFKNEIKEEAESYKSDQTPIPIIFPQDAQFLEIPTGFDPDCQFYPEPYEYLFNRGVDLIGLKSLCRIYYSNYQERIIFPIYNDSQLVGYQSRDITGKQEPKYLISKGFKKNKYLYNYDAVYNNEVIVLVEGIFDVIKNLSGCAVASFGKHLSKSQLKRLLNMPNLKKIYMAYDNDAEEEKLAYAEVLSDFFEVYIVRYPTIEDDPGSLSFEDLAKCLEAAEKFEKKNSLDISAIL